MKILNLYAGIGGNRELWTDCEVTSVEYNKDIAEMYRDKFPKDTLIIGDAHQYLLDHYKEYDFIWSSPPCQSHSRTNYFLNEQGIVRYPDMRLYQEILFLKNFYKGKWCIENVIGYYDPLITPTQIGRHYLWSNFIITNIEQPKDDIGKMCGKNQTASKKHITERNAVNTDLGLHVFNCAKSIYISNSVKQGELF